MDINQKLVHRSKCTIFTNGFYSDEFTITRSIRQGGVLSMLMMAVAFYDIHTFMDPQYDHGVAHGNVYLGTPACADDVMAFSLTKSGLQDMLDNATHTPSDGGFHFLLVKVKL